MGWPSRLSDALPQCPAPVAIGSEPAAYLCSQPLASSSVSWSYPYILYMGGLNIGYPPVMREHPI